MSATASSSFSLNQAHWKFLRDRAVADNVAEERGYKSANKKSELFALGFGRSQQIISSLVIPIHTVRRAVESYQLRPDSPRLDTKGKALRYEMKAKVTMLLDFHPRLTTPNGNGVALMGDPSIPLIITEGIPKADSAVSIGLCCCALLGVWNWRGKNGARGTTALADWESVALNDRSAFIAFDSDVMQKRQVYGALCRLKPFLESRKAKVKLIYLPVGEHGEKLGLDDYIAREKATGRSDDEIRNALMALATSELRKPTLAAVDSADDRELDYEPDDLESIFLYLERRWAKLGSEPGFIIRLNDGKAVSTKRFCEAVADVQLHDEEGKKKNAGAAWLNSRTPLTVTKEIFLPHPLGESPASDFTEIYEGQLVYNHWRGWPAMPAAQVDNEAIKIYFAVRDWLFKGQPKVVKWLERWIAHKLLYPDIKQPNVPILIGWQGSGKDSLARFYAGLFGEHAEHIQGCRLTSRFNSFLGYKLFVTIGELEDASPAFFKDLISNKVENIERKFVDVQTGPSYLQLFASTNERTPYLLKADDRRGGIFRVCRGKDRHAARINTAKVAKLENLITAKAYSGIYPYFMKLDLKGYNPFAEPYHTTDKDDLIHMHRSDAEQFVIDVLGNLDDGWRDYDGTPNHCDLATAQDFAYLFGAPPSLRKKLLEDKRGLTQIGKWLAEIFVRGTVNGGKPVRTKSGLCRLWPIRRAGIWYSASPEAIRAHYDAHSLPVPPPPSKDERSSF